MAIDPPEELPAPDRRATWVALRTLHQRPKVVGRSDAGDVVYEVKSVRLILRPDGSHFNRLVNCSKCGAAVPGRPMLNPADLEHPSNPIICKDCVRSGTPPVAPPEPWLRRLPSPGRHEAAARTSPPRGPVDTAGASEPDEVVDLIEAAGAPDGEAVTQAPDTARDDEDEDSDAAGDRLNALERRMEELAAGLASATSAASAAEARATAAYEEMRTAVAALAEQASAQSRDLAGVAKAVGDVQTELAAVGEWSRQVSQAHGDLGARLEQLVQRLDGEAGRLTEVSARLGDLDTARADLDERLGSLRRAIADTEAQIAALTASAGTDAGRMQALEAKVQTSVRRMTRLVGAQQDSRPPPPRHQAPPATGLLDDLERQLQEAEARLAGRPPAGDGPP